MRSKREKPNISGSEVDQTSARSIYRKESGGQNAIRGSQSGQIMVLFTLMLVGILGLVALTIDVGIFLHQRQDVQNAVDAAALAGAQELPDDALTAQSLALQYAETNDTDLDPSSLDVSFRCLVGDRDSNGQPDPSDIPGVCNPGGNSVFTCKNKTCASPCVPSEGDTCNTVVVSGNKDVPFYFAPALSVMGGPNKCYFDQCPTGDIRAAACRGACGGPPTQPLDVIMILDRTSSMSSSDVTNAKNAAKSVLQIYGPQQQWVGLGLLGPSRNTSSCSGSNSPGKGVPATTSNYNSGLWVPVGLTGASAPVNENYQNANGSLNTSSLIVKTINCFSTSSVGTNLVTPMKKAKEYLLANGRPGVKKGIILMGDGTPNYNGAGLPSDHTCQVSVNEAQAAKNANIEIFIVGFGVAGERCPDSSGIYRNQPVTRAMAAMATDSNDNGCTSAENTDGDHFFCEPKTGDLTPIFQQAAITLASGSKLVQLPD